MRRITKVDVERRVEKDGVRFRVLRYHLDNGEVLEPRQVVIAEGPTSEGAPVKKLSNGKWYRCDYSKDNPDCYPFNFVACPDPPGPPATQVAGENLHDRISNLVSFCPEMNLSTYAADLHTGYLDVVLTVLSPTIVSHPPSNDRVLSPEDQEEICRIYKQALDPDGLYGPTDMETEKYSDEMAWRQRIRPSAQVAPGMFIIPATTLKGMVRSVIEALTLSFAPFVSPELEGQDAALMSHRLGGQWLDARGTLRKERWRCPDARRSGIRSRDDATHYTYDFVRQGKHIGYWKRWVPKGLTPADKVAYLNGQLHPDQWTLADRMFGRVTEFRDVPNWAGRIRFEDAVGWRIQDGQRIPTAKAVDNFWFVRPLTRPAGAKAKCEAIYLLPTPNGSVDEYNNRNSRFRGRKWYWAHSLGGPGEPGALPLTEVQQRIVAAGSPQNAWGDAVLQRAVLAFANRVRGHKRCHAAAKSWLKPLLPGSQFFFRVHFENLTDLELGALIKGITLFNEENGALSSAKHCHRLGRGKPLGFGSVVLTLSGVHLLDVAASFGKVGPMVWHGSEMVSTIFAKANQALDSFSRPWQNPVWSSLMILSRIPDALTDYDYWKNWTDYAPRTAKPLGVV